MVSDPADQALLDAARQAQRFAHAPYSRFHVGAALRMSDGSVFTGCNVEISSYSLTCCAERTALFKAVSEGHTRITAIAVVTDADPPASPCGACRQVLHDFADGTVPVLMGGSGGATRSTTLGALLPLAFGPDDLLKRP